MHLCLSLVLDGDLHSTVQPQICNKRQLRSSCYSEQDPCGHARRHVLTAKHFLLITRRGLDAPVSSGIPPDKAGAAKNGWLPVLVQLSIIWLLLRRLGFIEAQLIPDGLRRVV